MWFPGISLVFTAVLGLAPNLVTQSNRRIVTDTDSVLTVKKVTQMKTFWSSYMKEPDSVQMAGRVIRRNSEVSFHLLPQEVNLVDITVMAAKYPSVAEDLKRAGLTARQWRIYRGTLFSAYLTEYAYKHVTFFSDVKPSGLLGENVAFLEQHRDLLDELRSAGLWFPAFQNQTAWVHREP